MADKKISALTALTAANVAPATDVVPIVDTSATETKKITAKDLVDGALNGGTANGVLYLNGSKATTSGSALVFDGTNLGIGTSSPGTIGVSGYTRLVLGAGSASTDGLTIVPSGTGGVQFTDAANVKKGYLQWDASTGALTLGTAGTTKATLDSSGNLGIGTSSPTYRLTILTPTSDATVGFNLRAYDNGLDGDRTVSSRYTSANNNNWANSKYQAWAHIWETNATEKMRLDSSGNLGIGTSSPGEKLEVNGAIKTAAPAGGTAASWKLGAVATVSPTSPNRTIEVDIGGTIYYIHAKTTNN